MSSDGRGTSAVLLVCAWLPFAVGIPLLFRAVAGEPGTGLLPGAGPLVVGVVGVVIGTVGFVRLYRRTEALAVSGPRTGRRIVVPLGRVPAEYRDRVPSRLRVARLLVPAVTLLSGLLLSLSVYRDRSVAETVTFVVLVALVFAVLAGCATAYVRRAERARPRDPGSPTG